MAPNPITITLAALALLAPHVLGAAIPADPTPEQVNVQPVITEVKPGFFIYDYPEMSENPNEQVKRELLKARDNECGASTFTNKTSTGSPLKSDCESLRDFFYANSHYWCMAHCYGSCKHVIATHNTCVFGVSGPIGNCVSFGNEDGGDLMRNSITKFSWNDAGTWRIGAEGDAKCPMPGTISIASWAIWHT